jgi:SAM-dependent methyltransferase
MPSDHPFTPDLFERMDESDDAAFYALPRKVVHLDPEALRAVERWYAEIVPEDGELLDLMSSWRSHLPAHPRARRIVGLGMSAEEMSDNPALTEHVVHDLNREPRLPFADESFDAAILTVSLQYLIHPIEVFRDVARVLRAGAPFAVVLSHRCFPTKAVKIWHQCQSMRERMELGMAYFQYAGGYADVVGVDLRPGARGEEDPVLAVIGRKQGGGDRKQDLGTGWRRR